MNTARARIVWGVVLAALMAGLMGGAPAEAAGPSGPASTWSARALPVTGHEETTKASSTTQTGTTRARLGAAAAEEPPEGVPSVTPGASPAGYLPLDQFGIAPTPIGDEEFVSVPTPAFVFAGRSYTSIAVSSNGYVKAGTATAADQNCCNLPSSADPAPPNGMIAPFWSDLDGTGAPGVYTGTLTDGVNSWIVVEWRVNVFGTTSGRVLEAWIGVNGVEDVSMVYDPADLPAAPPGQDFLVGAENSAGQGQMSATLPTQDLRVTSTVPIVPGTVQPVTGSAQTAESGDAFAQPLVAAVTGTDGQPYAGAEVTFAVESGPATFAGGVTSVTVTSDSAGRATAPSLLAGPGAGTVVVVASTRYASSATFSLMVTRTPLAISAVSGSGQSAAARSSFARPLVAAVTSKDGGAVAGAPVTFSVTSGSATFAGSTTATTTSGTDGQATAPTLTAGSAPGAVTVTAQTPGVTQVAMYTLTVTAASADLAVTLGVPTAAVRTGTPFTVSVVVSNAGPSPATNVASGLALPASTRVVDGGGGLVSRDGRGVAFVRSSLGAGQSVAYTVRVVADGAAGTRTLTAATVSTQVRDPRATNNASSASVVVRRS